MVLGALLIVLELETVMSPAPALVDNVVVPFKVMGRAKERLVFTVKRVPDKVTVPVPAVLISEKAPAIEVPPPAVSVRRPELSMATGPDEVVITLPLIEMSFPVKEMPLPPLVVSA